jgi:hypothetical protein
VNGRIEHKNDGTIYPYGKDFDQFANAYHIVPTAIRDDKFYNMRVCLHYNLLNICNDGKEIILKYTAIDKRNTMEILKQDKNVTIMRLKREIERAALVEDFVKAASLQKELNRELKELDEGLTANTETTYKSRQ